MDEKMEIRLVNPTEDGFLQRIDWNKAELEENVRSIVAAYQGLSLKLNPIRLRLLTLTYGLDKPLFFAAINVGFDTLHVFYLVKTNFLLISPDVRPAILQPETARSYVRYCLTAIARFATAKTTIGRCTSGEDYNLVFVPRIRAIYQQAVISFVLSPPALPAKYILKTEPISISNVQLSIRHSRTSRQVDSMYM